jgi:hypothetical protein
MYRNTYYNFELKVRENITSHKLIIFNFPVRNVSAISAVIKYIIR